MITESYDYLTSKNKEQYFFESIGEQGSIIKVVLITHIEDDLWNLGFGDLNKGKIDDSVVSNNQDIVKIMGTIAKIVYEYSKEFPYRGIKINPIDEKRKKLYNHVFRRNYDFLITLFHITGTIDGQENPMIFLN